MLVFLFALAFLALALGVYPLALATRFRRYVDRELAQPAPEAYKPKVTVVLPCKGIDPGFEENLSALVNQDYPDYEVIFVTATDDDPAYPVLSEFAERDDRFRLFVAGIRGGRAQKLNNQLKGLSEAREDAEVFVFVDSDVRPRPDFLSYMVAPLAESNIGATTGFRWYLPEGRATFATMLRSTWNGGGLPFLLDVMHNYAYGGAMAIRRDDFEKAGIGGRWQTALSDDMTLTEEVKEEGVWLSWEDALTDSGLLTMAALGGEQKQAEDDEAFSHVYVHKSALRDSSADLGPGRLQIKFVPQCLTVSEEDSTLAQVVEWTNRQTIVAKVYNKHLWWSIAFAHGFTNAMLLLGLVLVAVGATRDLTYLIPGLLMLGLVPMLCVNALPLMPCVEAMMPAHRDKLRSLMWWYFVLPPLASLLSFFNTLYSLTTDRITWRGVVYELRSPTETVVVETRDDDASDSAAGDEGAK